MAAAFLACGLTIALCPPVLACLRRWRLLDVPGDRSSHAHPTPRGGGIAPALGATVALAFSSAVSGQARTGLIAAALLFGFIGLLEDSVGVPALRRLVVQVLAGALAAPWLLTAWSGGQGWRVAMGLAVVVWLVSYVNAFNFMDGIDGISVAQAVVAGTAWYLVGWAEGVASLEIGGLIVAGAALGFAPFNFPKARMFLGDVGSYYFGALLAALAVVGVRAGIPPEAVAAPLAVYLADTGVTLVRRVRRGEVWYSPHRDHTYQRLVQHGWSHARTTLSVAAVMAVVSALGSLALTDSLAIRVAGDLLVVGVLAAYLRAPAWLAHERRATLLDPA
jgi:UDP-N-acetylmuramyl pentapeptide phosphotransferase/UDP-N-acetylglucosamine-1-phosphate transferase